MKIWWYAYSWRRVVVTGNVPRNDGFAALPNVAMALAGSAGVRSPGRTWDGVEAMRFRPASAEISVPALSNHLVVLHLGPAVDVGQRAGGGRLSERLVGTGGSAVVPAGLASEWRWGGRGAGPAGGEADSLHLYLAPALIREAARDVGVDPDRVELVGSVGGHDQQIERIGLSLLPELDTEEPLGGGLFAGALARALAVHLLREHSTLGWGARRAAYREPGGGLSKLALKRATDYVGDNLAGDLALARLSRAASTSPYHFSRLFKESTGLSPHQYVIRQRVEKARDLLTNTDLPLHEVAAATGFAHQSHMGHHLKRILGVSPTRLRSG